MNYSLAERSFYRVGQQLNVLGSVIEPGTLVYCSSFVKGRAGGRLACLYAVAHSDASVINFQMPITKKNSTSVYWAPLSDLEVLADLDTTAVLLDAAQ